MKQIFLLIIFLSSIVFSKSIQLTKDELKDIKAAPNSKAITKRLVQYVQLKRKIYDYELIRKLSHVNSFFNRILPVNDSTKYNADDYWATPKEFLVQGKGDCEDYAIAKYFTLKETGIDKNKLFLAVVQVKGETSYHMVLLYIENKKSMPLVLDNLSSKVIPFNKRKKLEAKFIFNEKTAYLLKNKKIHKEVKINWGKVNKWEKLLHRVYTLKE